MAITGIYTSTTGAISPDGLGGVRILKDIVDLTDLKTGGADQDEKYALKGKMLIPNGWFILGSYLKVVTAGTANVMLDSEIGDGGTALAVELDSDAAAGTMVAAWTTAPILSDGTNYVSIHSDGANNDAVVEVGIFICK